MMTTVRVLLSAATFTGTIAVIYWFWSYEVAGTILLGLMTVALGFAATMVTLRSRREAPPPGDYPNLGPEDVAGQIVEFSEGSPWPIILAVGFALGVTGLVYGWWLVFPGAILVIAALLGLMWDTRLA